MPTTIGHLRLPSADDLARRCEDAHRDLLRVQWAVEDADRDERMIHFDDLHEWIESLRSATAALALAAAVLSSPKGQLAEGRDSA